MMTSLATLLVLTLAAQSLATDRARAEELARAGRNADALALFERIVVETPDDVEAQLWIARLDLRLGRAAEAEAEFRAVLKNHPSDIDARIGLAGVLLRRTAWQEALNVLREAESAAGDNADLFAVLGRAYRRAGDDPRALE
jgi:predicted Zn-dependent protease